ncbi:MAG: CYTH domain-containing protein [archaeon]
MKITICGSVQFADRLVDIYHQLKELGHEPMMHKNMFGIADGSAKELISGIYRNHAEVKRKNNFIKWWHDCIKSGDAVLICNFDKKNIPNYIGGNTLMEMGFAHVNNKKIFLLNPVPKEVPYSDEIEAMVDKVLHGDLTKIAQKKIEVEIRSFITKEQYEHLRDFFIQNAVLIKEDFQETYYFNCPQDLRIQKNSDGAKIWLKKGSLHEDFREEIEIKINREDFEKAKQIFSEIGLDVEIKWLRERSQFDWSEIKVCLDYTKGYGYIIELEKITSEERKEKVLDELKQKMSELKIPITSKEIFNERFNYYKNNWRLLIGE